MCLLACLPKRVEDLEAKLEMARKRIDELESSVSGQMYECKICMDAPIQKVFLPCGHTLSCSRCAQDLETCPVCALGIENMTSVHMM